MFAENVEKTEYQRQIKEDMHYDKIKEMKRDKALRFVDMQKIVNARLGAGQASVDNAQNFPSTWSTNPDGGANGQV